MPGQLDIEAILKWTFKRTKGSSQGQRCTFPFPSLPIMLCQMPLSMSFVVLIFNFFVFIYNSNFLPFFFKIHPLYQILGSWWERQVIIPFLPIQVPNHLRNKARKLTCGTNVFFFCFLFFVFCCYERPAWRLWVSQYRVPNLGILIRLEPLLPVDSLHSRETKKEGLCYLFLSTFPYQVSNSI